MIKNKDVRKGSQIPTNSFILPYQNSDGDKAISLYNSTGREAQEWQELLLYDILAKNEEELWVHTKFGYSVPRRNGKSEILLMRELYGLSIGEHIMHTAHRTSTTHASWERLYDLIEKAGFKIKSSYRASGKEHIEIKDGGKIEFRTRTSKGGLGEGFDLLIIDEAQEYQDDQESALKYVVTDSDNPQTLFCGTPPTAVSSGTVFQKMRDNVLAGKARNSGWAEWAVDCMTDPEDAEAWYLTNPSLGTVFSERSVQDEIGNDDVDFNIQRLGLWLKYNQKSVISENAWNALKVDVLPKLKGKLFVGIKSGLDGKNISMSIAVKTEDDRIFIETIDCKAISAGFEWIYQFLSKADVDKVVLDGGNASYIQQELKDRKIKVKTVIPKVSEVITAYSSFEQAIYNKTLCHSEQPSLDLVATNLEYRNIGNSGGRGFRSIKQGADVTLIDTCVLAHWLATTKKAKKKQKMVAC